MTSEDWLAQAATELGVEALTEAEATALLDLARDVAHNTERRYAPLTCFLMGLAAADRRDQVAVLAESLGKRATS